MDQLSIDNLSVLFVDDERHILNSLRRLLRHEPYTTHFAESGPAGLEVLQQHPIHMVVSDQRMPEMTGTEFLQQVKQRWPDTVRVVLSGYAEAGVIVEAINQGEVYRFVGKPWNDEELKTTFRQCLDHYLIIQDNRRLTRQSARQVAELQRLNGLLAESVEVRTRLLQFAQEVLESLPVMVLGISREGELMLTNQSARAEFTALSDAIPGADIGDLLPADIVAAVRHCLADGECRPFTTSCADRLIRGRPAPLGHASEPRGCVLLLEKE